MRVVIPAYDEGAMVAKAIDSVASARYPLERLEIVMADDGGTDDTWQQIQLAVARRGGRVRAVRQDRNRGKRHALAAGGGASALRRPRRLGRRGGRRGFPPSVAHELTVLKQHHDALLRRPQRHNWNDSIVR